MTIDDRPVRALNLMKEALRLLDDAKAAADIGAYLDLAIHRLRESLDSTVDGSSKDPAA